MTIGSLSTSGELEDLRKRFLAVGFELQEIGKRIDLEIVATHDPRLSLFSRLPTDRQLKIIELLESSRDVYQTLLSTKSDLRQPTTVVWAALKRMNLTPPSDFFDKIADGDVIEIYSLEDSHLFVNLKFFELCSYTLEETFCKSWQELWERDEGFAKEIADSIHLALEPGVRKTQIVNTTPHRIREISSIRRYNLEYFLKASAPLWDRVTSRKVAYAVIERGRVVGYRS